MHYRSVHQDADELVGTVSGGPMYYIEHGLGRNWKWMAIFFAAMLGFTAFLTGNAISAASIASRFSSGCISGCVSSFMTSLMILAAVHRDQRRSATFPGTTSDAAERTHDQVRPIREAVVLVPCSTPSRWTKGCTLPSAKADKPSAPAWFPR